MKKVAIMAIAIATYMLVSSAAGANTGMIAGVVLDESSGRPVIGASVLVEGTSTGAACDLEGRYYIRDVPAGEHAVVVASVGFSKRVITGVKVQSGQTTTLDASLSTQATEIEKIEVTAERARATEDAVLIKRRSAASVTDGISAETIRRSGDSHAGEAIQRIVGVTAVDDKRLVVRGMAGRYSTVQLNGSPLPSPEPESREVPLDMFPGGMIQELITSKTFTPDKPASFTGGSVDLVTKDYPSRFTLNLSGTGTYNSATTGEPRLTFDRTLNGLPDVVRDADLNDPVQKESAGEALALHQWTPSNGTTAPANSSYSVSAGNRMALGDGGLTLGLMGSYVVNHSNSTKMGRYAEYRGGGERIGLDYKTEETVITDVQGGLMNVTLAINPSHQIAAKGLYNSREDSEARIGFGWTEQTDSAMETRVRYIQREIKSLQVSGSHAVDWLAKSRVDWRLTGSQALRDEPMSRSNAYNVFHIDDQQYIQFDDGGLSGANIFTSLADDDANVSLDWALPMGKGGGEIKLGALHQAKDRNFQATRLIYFSQGGRAPINGMAEDIFTTETIGPDRDQYGLRSATKAGDRYDVDDHNSAVYTMAQIPLLKRFRLIAGARFEDNEMTLHTDQNTGTGFDGIVRLKTVDWFPMASVVWRATDRMNFRAVVSRTLARPEYRELAPYFFQDFSNGRAVRGNPDLTTSYIKNYDLRWEVFPRSGELMAVSYFRKDFTRPIESHADPAHGGESTAPLTWKNSASASSRGVELEARKSLGFVSELLQGLQVGGSVAIIDSKVEDSLISVETGEPTKVSTERPLTGESPYVINLIISYTQPNSGTDAALLYNAFGDRLVMVGAYASDPPYYEQTRHGLDFTFSQRVWQYVSLKFGAKNILDEDYVVTQTIGVTQGAGARRSNVIEQYEIGRSFSLGITWSL